MATVNRKLQTAGKDSPGNYSRHSLAGLNDFHLPIEHQVEGEHLAECGGRYEWSCGVWRRWVSTCILTSQVISLSGTHSPSQRNSMSSGTSSFLASTCDLAATLISRIRNCTWSYRSMSSLLFFSNRKHFCSLSPSQSKLSWAIGHVFSAMAGSINKIAFIIETNKIWIECTLMTLLTHFNKFKI